MQGDFTRSTFDAKKHYTSVRMQQGRLQLDSDWNEQVDIQNHLYQARAIDMIGSDSGVSSVDPETGRPSTTSFQIRIVQNAAGESDLAIAPGHLYVNGSLSELESGTSFAVIPVANDPRKLQVFTPVVDGRSLAQGQWFEVVSEEQPTQTPRFVKIAAAIDTVQRMLPFEETVNNIKQLRRLLTYTSQPDYPNPTDVEAALKQAKQNQTESQKHGDVYAAYVDVWQRHITTIDDPTIREIALNIPDTTTRTKTVWQLRLQRFVDLPNSDNSSIDELPDSLQSDEWKSAIDKRWATLLQQNRDRRAYLNACAKSCPPEGTLTSTSGYTGEDNQLYRVEIHTPGKSGVATFKWSRDNASVVSQITAPIKGNKITIRRSDRELWQSSIPRQWLEITSEEQELKGKPGTFVRFREIVDNQITFDIISEAPPDNASKVRRWHTTDVAAVPVTSAWVELEAGIKVQFDPESEYQTGDYWLIPARAASNDIIWPTDGANQPIPQLRQGIYHDYGLLALIRLLDGKFPAPDSQDDRRDCRTIFPPLLRCLDRAGGTIEGPLEVQGNLRVTEKFDPILNRTVAGKLGIGIPDQPTISARLHVRAAAQIPGNGTVSRTNDKTLSGTDTQFEQELRVGDLLVLSETEQAIVTGIAAEEMTLDTDLNAANRPFFYQQPIVRFEDSRKNLALLITADGRTGIGTATPNAKLQVAGDTHIGTTANAANLTVTGNIGTDGTLQVNQQTSLATTTGTVTIGSATNAANLNVLGDVTIAKTLQANQGATFATNTGVVTVGSVTNPANLNVLGDVTIAKTLEVKQGSKFATDAGNVDIGTSTRTANLTVSGSVTVGTTLTATGNTTIGTASTLAKLQVLGNVAIGGDTAFINAISQPANGLTVQGKVGIGKSIPDTELDVNGTISANRYLGNGSALTGVISTSGGTITGDLTIQKTLRVTETVTAKSFQGDGSALTGVLKPGDLDDELLTLEDNVPTIAQGGLTVVDDLVRITRNTQSVELGSRDGIWAHFSSSFPRFHFDRAVTIEAKDLQAEAGEAFSTAFNIVPQFASDGKRHYGLTVQSGRVSIGEPDTDSGAELYVRGDLEATSEIKGDRVVVESGVVRSPDNPLILRVKDNNDKPFMILNDSGKVGINVDGNAFPDSAKEAQLYVNGKLFVDGETFARKSKSESFQTISSRSLKANIAELSSQEVTELIKQLNPVKFTYTANLASSFHAGFIAEDTPDLLTSEDKQAVKILDVVAVLTKVVKDHREVIASLNRVVKQQQQTIAILTQKVADLEQKR